jgi:serpin B
LVDLFPIQPEVSRSSINQWFEAATAGLIKDFLPPGSVSTATRSILGSALYFKGVWARKFDAQLTQLRTFHLHAFMQVQVPFMSSRKRQYIACRPDWKVLKLPYACGGNGLQSMLQKLASSPELLDEVHRDLMTAVPVGDFWVPKFTISYKAEATGLLQGLGLHLPFDHTAADFSEMLESTNTAADAGKGFVVSHVYHQSFVEVNEKGTEAAAATAFGSMCTSASSRCVVSEPVLNFVADHPFMYLIKEELTGVVVFAGQVVNPSL